MDEEIIEQVKKDFPDNLYKFRGVAYGGVLIPPRGKNIASSRNTIHLGARFSKGILMNQPIVAANMIDITESKMMETSSLLGGLGIMHRFCPISFQAAEVRKAKRAHNFIIRKPYQVAATATVGEARKIMEERGIGSLLVRNELRLAGILTARDIKLANDAETVTDRMTPRKKLVLFNERDGKSRECISDKFRKTKVKHYPIVDDNNVIRGLICVKDVFKLEKYPNANTDRNGQLVVGAAIGAVGDFIERADELIGAGANVIIIDITSGHSVQMGNAVKSFRQKFGDFQLVAGNVGTSEQADFLIKLGVDGIKIGVGPGGVCTTRINTGIGVTQLYAILEIYWRLIIEYGYKTENIPPLCADGNIRRGADVSHALMAVADSVMIGTVFSATEETPGRTLPGEDGEYKRLRGMASIEALVERYEAEGVADPVSEALKKNPEGIEKMVKVKGSAANIIRRLNGGLKSSVSHRGELSLKQAKHRFNPFCPKYGFEVLTESARRESYER